MLRISVLVFRCIKNTVAVNLLLNWAINDEEKSIIALSEKMPVFIAPNTSVVTALMKDFAKKISKIDQSLEIHISESHNKSKKDAPSERLRILLVCFN